MTRDEKRAIKTRAFVVRLVLLFVKTRCSIPVGPGWCVDPDGRLVQHPEEWTDPWRQA